VLSARLRLLPVTLVSVALVGGVAGAVPAHAATTTTSTQTTVSVTTVAAPTVTTTSTAVATSTVAASTSTTVSTATTYAARLAAYRAHTRAKAVAVAKSRLGARYRAGRVGPWSFDCSGLAIYVAKKAYGKRLPHYSKAQYRATKRVSRAHLRPGDLVFFFKRGTHHVGIYIGHGLMVSATNPRHGVRIDPVFTGWYGTRYSGAGRLV